MHKKLTKLIVFDNGLEAQFRLKPNNEEEEEGEIEDDDDEDDNECDDTSKLKPTEGGNVSKKNSTQSHDEALKSLKKRISLKEMQNFLIALLLPEPRLSNPPDWCKVVKCLRAPHVGIFLIDNTDIDWIEDPGSKFTHAFRFETAPDWIEKLTNVTLSHRQQSLNESQMDEFETKFDAPIKVSKTNLLLSPLQMIAEKYPMPTHEGIVILRDGFKEVSNTSPIFAIDCEMCLTTGNVSELTRISIVDEEMRNVYNQLVMPKNDIIDYLTRYSGITASMMKGITNSLKDVHEFIKEKLPSDAILCGHSLDSDMRALKLFHPYVIDTSVIYNKSGDRAYKPSLKSLAYEFLGKEIQTSKSSGHDSMEDAVTAMELLKLKMVNGKLFGDIVATKVSQGVVYDQKTGCQIMSIDKFVERHNLVNLAYRYIDTTPNARFIYIHDENQPPTDDLKQVMHKLLETPHAICVALTSNGNCYLKI